MGRRRKLDAAISADIEDEEETGPAGRLGGFWGGSALNMLQARLDETQSSVVGGILAGTIALKLDPAQIDDEVGSDRVGDWDRDDAFRALKDDIARRGQKQPIRVRPAEPDWAPDPLAPMRTDARFVIQSGRRRLEALRRLDQPVLAVVSTEAGDATREDLEERFKENTMRQNLSGFEELLSIGLIAEAHQDLSQAEIARKLAVPAGDVSLGLSCVEYHGPLLAMVDVANTPKRDFRQIIPRLRQGKNPQPSFRPTVSPKPAKPKPAPVRLGRRQVLVKPTKTGFTLAVRGHTEPEEELRKIARELLEILEMRGAGG